MKKWFAVFLVAGCVSSALAIDLSQKTTAMGLSVNDFVPRFGPPDQVVNNIDAYSQILRYDPANNKGLFLRAYFVSGQCVAVMSRLPSPLPAAQLLPDGILMHLKNKEYQIMSDAGRARIGTAGFDNYWALELSVPDGKKWDPSTQSVVNLPADLSSANVSAFGYGKKDYFLQTLHREPSFAYITSENFFKPGATLPTQGYNVTPQ